MPATPPLPAFVRRSVTGLVLAGGQARRMGGVDKGLVPLAGRPMIEYALQALRPQVGTILINANRNLEAYGRYGHPVLSDAVPGFLGPLAGTLTALRVIETPYLLTVPCDSPLLARDLAERMVAAGRAAEAEITVAHDGERQQPVFLLVRRELAPALEAFLAGGGRKIDQWFSSHRLAQADLSHDRDSFVNVNDPGERERIEALLLSQPGAQ